MSFFVRRSAAKVSFRARSSRHVSFLLLTAGYLAASAHAVVVRGHVTDALGKPLANGQVRLVEGGKVVAMAFADKDGSYELRSSDAGRFTLLGFANGYLPGIGVDFYAGATDVLQREVVLATDTVKQDVTVTATGLSTPLPQLTSPITVIPGEALVWQSDVVQNLRQAPGNFVVQTGGLGGVTSLFIRGGNSTANLVTVDGMPADDVGGTFDFGTVSSTAVAKIDVLRGPDSAIYGTDAGAGVVAIETPRGATLEPLLTYSGDAGNLHTYRNEVTGSGIYKRADYFGAFSRLETANDLQYDQYHNATAAANLGYDFNGNTLLRFTMRRGVSATGLPGATSFDGVSESGKQSDQDLYSTATLENRYKGSWHNLVRYGITRKREQAAEYQNVGILYTFYPGTPYSYQGYVGTAVTIHGANGYTATGQVPLYTGNIYDQASNRDQLYYQSDYTANRHFAALFGFRYDNERGSYNDYDPAYAYVEHQKIQRTNFEYNLQLQGEFFNRLFYSAGGAVEKNHLYGIAGTPRVGLTYIPIRPNGRALHGTRLRANYATGVQEPTLALEEASLYDQVTPAQIAQFHLAPPGAERSKTYDVGLDQNIASDKLVLKAGYFHNVFDRQLEGVDSQALLQYFGIGVTPAVPATNPACPTGTGTIHGLCPLPNVYTAYTNSLAYRAQGAELELTWHPKPHFLLRGGYTYLDTRVVQSFSSDVVAANTGVPTANPNLPGIAIGGLSPLVGARVFRRPPHTGYFDARYTHKKLSLALTGAMASRSDDSTFLAGEDLNGLNTLLLPNRDLDFGYVQLDLGGSYALKRGFTYFAQINNLLNDQRIGPIGYPGLPLTFRTGLKLRLGGD
jgi:vitamin B12 transporter